MHLRTSILPIFTNDLQLTEINTIIIMYNVYIMNN